MNASETHGDALDCGWNVSTGASAQQALARVTSDGVQRRQVQMTLDLNVGVSSLHSRLKRRGRFDYSYGVRLRQRPPDSVPAAH